MAHAIGEETLRRISEMPRFNRWMYENIRPYLGHRIIEIGCGIGNFTEMLLDHGDMMVLDIEEDYIEHIRHRWNGSVSLQALRADLSASRPQEVIDFQADTIVCLNVLEHIEDHRGMLENMHHVLAPGGRLILLVPAFQWLYGSLDVGLGHFRRYTKKSLGGVVSEKGFDVERIFYMNMFGIPGWWFSGRVLKRDILPKRALGLYHTLTPMFRAVEKTTGPPVGQSLICVARKG